MRRNGRGARNLHAGLSSIGTLGAENNARGAGWRFTRRQAGAPFLVEPLSSRPAVRNQCAHPAGARRPKAIVALEMAARPGRKARAPALSLRFSLSRRRGKKRAASVADFAGDAARRCTTLCAALSGLRRRAPLEDTLLIRLMRSLAAAVATIIGTHFVCSLASPASDNASQFATFFATIARHLTHNADSNLKTSHIQYTNI